MENILQDLRYGIRMMLKTPAFTAVAVLALALGIGTNTAIFSIINGVLLKPLGFKDPDRLVKVWENWGGFEKGSVSYPNYQDWRERNRSFDKMSAYRSAGFTLTGGEMPERVSGKEVSADFLSVLGVAPALGRDFREDEDRLGANLVAIISNGLWQRRFGSDPSIIGKTVILNGDSYSIIGVLSPDFHFYNNVDVYVSIRAKKNIALDDDRSFHPGIQVVARLKHVVSIEQARADMVAIANGLAEQYPDTNKAHTITIGWLYDDVVRDVRNLLLILFAAVAFVLLIACANVANLMLAKAAARQKEIAIRSALGASRFRIARQLITESVLLSLVGGGLGLLTAFGGTGFALKVLPDILPRADEIKIDARVLIFTLAASILTGIFFGLAPALQSSRPDLNETLKEGGRTGTGGRQSVRNGLVVAEVGLALVLLVGAGLLIRSFISLQQVNPGFDAKNLLSFDFSLSTGKYTEAAKMRGFYKEFLEKLRSLPGVQAASATTLLPLDGNDNEIQFSITGRPAPSLSELPLAMNYITLPGYLEAMRIPLLKGRYFDEHDDQKSTFVTVIDENMEKQYFQGEDPIGKHITVQGGKDVSIDMEIIGVIGHVKQENLYTESGSNVQTQLYISYYQLPDKFVDFGMDVLVRTNSDPSGFIASIRKELREIDPNVPMYNARTMDKVVGSSISDRRFVLILLGLFSILALALASIGIYGVISYSVTQRTHEIGIRMALGAGRRQILTMVLGNGARLALIGIAIGVVGSLALTRFISTFLFGVSPTDPLTFFGISIILSTVALLASYIPARRAMKVDPMVALRYE